MSDFKNDSLAEWMYKSSVGFWEFDVNTDKVRWSDGFYHVLGYDIGEIACSNQYFNDYLLYYEDRDLFFGSINAQNATQLNSVEIRLLAKAGYQWFRSTMQKQKNAKITGTLINIHEWKIAELQSLVTNSELLEGHQLLQIGGWSINCNTRELIVEGDGLRVLDIREKSIPLDALSKRIDPVYQAGFESAIASCIQLSQPFELDVLVKTAFKNKRWVKIKGRAHINSFGICTDIKGTAQNIDDVKKKEAELSLLIDNISRQKDKLQNFAYIAAHNFNSHANNLKLLVDYHALATNKEDRRDLFEKIKTLSHSLKTTIDNLNEIVRSGEQAEEKSLIELDSVLNNTKNALDANIKQADACVTGDFSECTHVYYVHAYIESIFHNLISNSIKYREPSRKTTITCKSKKINGSVCLFFEDNGIGIDIEKHGANLFGMFQTFNANHDARGLGLYITKNQVEQYGGSIRVESELNKGTKFIIELNDAHS